jgi:hypothetical protein
MQRGRKQEEEVTMETKHTPEPWEIADTSIIAGDICIAVIEDDGGYEAPYEERQANAARIVACVNALAGLNPEAIKDVVEALQCFTTGAEKLHPIHFDEGTQYGSFMRDMRERFTSALAKLKEGQQC